jgi:hypothetical protein
LGRQFPGRALSFNDRPAPRNKKPRALGPGPPICVWSISRKRGEAACHLPTVAATIRWVLMTRMEKMGHHQGSNSLPLTFFTPLRSNVRMA